MADQKPLLLIAGGAAALALAARFLAKPEAGAEEGGASGGGGRGLSFDEQWEVFRQAVRETGSITGGGIFPERVESAPFEAHTAPPGNVKTVPNKPNLQYYIVTESSFERAIQAAYLYPDGMPDPPPAVGPDIILRPWVVDLPAGRPFTMANFFVNEPAAGFVATYFYRLSVSADQGETWQTAASDHIAASFAQTVRVIVGFTPASSVIGTLLWLRWRVQEGGSDTPFDAILPFAVWVTP